MGSSYSVYNDTGTDIWVKSTCHQGALIGIGVGLAVIGTLVTAGAGGAAAGSAAATFAAGFSASATVASAGMAIANVTENIRSSLEKAGYTKVRPGGTFTFSGTLSLVQTCHVSTGTPSPDTLAKCLMGCGFEVATLGAGTALKFTKKGKEMSQAGKALAESKLGVNGTKAAGGVGLAGYAGKGIEKIIKELHVQQTFTAWTGATDKSNRKYSLKECAPEAYKAATIIASMDAAA